MENIPPVSPNSEQQTLEQQLATAQQQARFAKIGAGVLVVAEAVGMQQGVWSILPAVVVTSLYGGFMWRRIQRVGSLRDDIDARDNPPGSGATPGQG